jgi:anti-sigma B factor antagonist
MTQQQPGDLAIEVRHVGANVEVTLSGELDIASAPALRRQLAELLRHRPEIAVVDLRDVGFIDSSGIHALLASRSHAIAAGTQLQIIRPLGHADHAFTMSGLEDLFPQIEASESLIDQESVPTPAV